MTDLLAATAKLVAIPSVSLDERAIADYVESRLRSMEGLEVVRVADNLVARTGFGLPVRVVLAGHLDTVPPTAGNDVARIDGDVLAGLGAADMKGGLAVMLDLASAVGRCRPLPQDVTFVFYVAEEIAREHSGLLALAGERPDLLAGDAAIVCEPTGCALEAGCQGVLKVSIGLAGRRAHVARPWSGRNAVHRLGPVLSAVSSWPARHVTIDGCEYRESLQAVKVVGGVASNVLPDFAGLDLNYRFAPDLDVMAAGRVVQELVEGYLEEEDAFAVRDSAPAARPSLDHPVLARLARLVAAGNGSVRAKLGWTDVAFFAERGVPAANFGPGDPEAAHTPGESVTRASLEQARRTLGQLLGV
ncbi:MAG: succinyl-diaminopimelate desuccinylase [Acidimicrobiales bacterium]